MAEDDEDVARFGALFRRFLEQVVHGPGSVTANALTRRLDTHLGSEASTLPVAAESWSPYRLPDVNRALSAVLPADAELLGVGSAMHQVEGLTVLVAAARAGHVDVGPVQRVTVAVGPDETETAIAAGLWLTVIGGKPAAVFMMQADLRRGRPRVVLEVLGADPEAAAAFLQSVQEKAVELSVLRGQVLSFGVSEFGPATGPLRFHRRPVPHRDDLVLPEGTLDVVERQVIGLAEHRERLREQGQHLKRGVLLHGPPGTGKTLTVRYLVGRMPDVTVLLLAGQTLAFISEAAELARAFQPALVVLEDCDLVAEDRSFSHGPQPLLFQVLDELDGLAEDADVTFLLTTNRAQVLEAALAQRPGRVDQAVEIPLPDDAGRRALFELYSRDVPLADDVDLDAVVQQTPGTTASYLKELVRRSALLAAIDGQPVVAGAHVTAALEELGAGRHALTRALVGGGDRAGAGSAGDGWVPQFRGGGRDGMFYGSALTLSSTAGIDAQGSAELADGGPLVEDDV
ncbi:MAG: cell division protease FtsH [Frankiaceae bacterium]|nr:cell division protease FtsH [Frankiaceae bacterium]